MKMLGKMGLVALFVGVIDYIVWVYLTVSDYLLAGLVALSVFGLLYFTFGKKK